MGEPIRILHVVQRMETAGIQSFLMNIYRYIDKKKVQFDFLVHYTEPQAYDDEIESLGGHVYKLSFREDKNFIKYRRNLSCFFSKHTEYQIVHGHMDSLGVFYLGEAKRAGIQNRIAHAHTVLIDNTPKKKIRHILNRSFKKNATQLIACSDEAGSYMFGSSPFYLIKNPIDVDRFAYDQQARENTRVELGVNGKHVVGHVGRFADAKNHEFLLRVFKQVYENDCDAILLLVGDGENKEKIAKLAHELGVYDAVLFAGIRNDVERMYQAMDIFVFPSIYEGLGIAVIEAQTSGLPVICSDRVPGIAHITDQCVELPLSVGTNAWAQMILNQIYLSNERHDRSDEIRAAGYDISAVSRELMTEYMNILGGYFNVRFISIAYMIIVAIHLKTVTPEKEVWQHE